MYWPFLVMQQDNLKHFGAIYPQDGVSEYLKATLSNSKYLVQGYISQGAAMNLAQTWESPFTGSTLGSVSGASNISGMLQAGTGLTSVARWNSITVWEGGTPPTFTLPLTFLAHYNPYREVSGAIAALLMMASPQLEDINKPLDPKSRIPEPVVLNIGRRINLLGVRIQDVSYDLDAPRDSSGLFLRNTVNLQLTGSSIYNSTDFNSIFQ